MKPDITNEHSDRVTLELTIDRSLFDRMGESGIDANIIAGAIILEHFERMDGSPSRSWPMVPYAHREAFRAKVTPALGKRFSKLPEAAKELLLADLEDADAEQALDDFEITGKTKKKALAIVRQFRMEGGQDEA